MFKDYYEVLDVPPSATAEEIRSSFRQLALRLHPDKQPVGTGAEGDPLARTENRAAVDFTEVQEAYEVLSDVARRYLYDLNYAELVTMRNQLAAQEELHRQREQQMRREQQERELREREKERAIAIARAAATAAAAAPADQVDVPDAFSMTHATHLGQTSGASAGEATKSRTVPQRPKKKRTVTPAAALSSAAETTKDQTPRPPPPPVTKDSSSEHDDIGSATSLSDQTVGKAPGLRDDVRATRKKTRTTLSSSAPGSLSNARLRPANPNGSTSASDILGSGGSSVKLPPLRLHKTVALSLDATNGSGLGNTKGNRTGALHSPEQEIDYGEEFYHKRAVERTLRVFFADFGFGTVSNVRRSSL